MLIENPIWCDKSADQGSSRPLMLQFSMHMTRYFDKLYRNEAEPGTQSWLIETVDTAEVLEVVSSLTQTQNRVVLEVPVNK